jgi:hypothetical protein
MQAGYSAVKFSDGVSNGIGVLSTSNGSTGSYGVWSLANEHTVGYLHADASGDYAPMRVDAGHVIVPAYWKGAGVGNNILWSPDAAWYVDVNDSSSMPYTKLKNIALDYISSVNPYIYSTTYNTGPAPFDAGGNLVIQGKSFSGTSKGIYVAGNYPTEIFASWGPSGAFTLNKNVYLKSEVKYQQSDAAALPPTRPTNVLKYTRSMTTNNQTLSTFYVSSTGTVTLSGATADVVANADTDTKLCIGTAPAQVPVIIKNRLGATKLVMVEFTYD